MRYRNTLQGSPFTRNPLTRLAAASALAFTAMSASAQLVAPSLTQEKLLSSVTDSTSAKVAADLPDAPSAVLAPAESSSSNSTADAGTLDIFQTPGGVSGGQIVPPGKQIAPAHAITIPAGWQAPPLTPRGKFAVALVESYSWESFAGYALAAGYSQVSDGQPNYSGGTGEAFGKRLGAAALRGTSENLIADGLLAAAFHEDPRYYIEGDSYSFIHRLFYSVTRPLVTQSDSGHRRVNASVLLGYLAASAITPAYYPKINRNARDVASTYGSSLGGAAVGFVFDEFVGDLLDTFHHRHQ
jgi:hypothetical protein